MKKEQEIQFKENIDNIIKQQIKNSFNDCLMETLNSAFIFKYVETLEIQLKKQQEIIDKAIEYINARQRKDEFLELNEWQTRDLLQILEEKGE